MAEAVRRPTYWIQTASFFMVSGAVSFLIVHQVPLLIEAVERFPNGDQGT